MTGDHSPSLTQSPCDPPPAAPPLPDVRGRGFARRAPLDDVLRWIDRNAAPAEPRAVPAAEAAGCVLGEPVAAPGDWPAVDRASRDGVAVASIDTLGAGTYNPIPLPDAVSVSAGDPLPPGCDAVLPVEAVQNESVFVEAVGSVALGDGVERRGEGVRAGTILLESGRILRPQDIGLLAALGIASVTVLPRPRVRIVLAGGPRHGACEALGAMLAALVARDGGVPDLVGPLPADRAALSAAFAAPGADLLLSAGRTGVGEDDVAPLALADAGSLEVHGVALRPGETAGAGVAAGVPAVLLPGEPMACLAAYDLLAGRAVRRMAGGAVRRMAGGGADLPYAVVQAVTARKLVSEIGCTDLYRVRLTAEGRVEPLASPTVPGLSAAVRADGFVLIPADSEGFPAGAPVTVHRYGAISL